MLSKFKRLPGLIKFNVIWNPAWFLITAYLAVSLHSTLEAVLMVLFGAFTVLAFYQAKVELEHQDRMAKIDEEIARTYDDIFGNTRK